MIGAVGGALPTRWEPRLPVYLCRSYAQFLFHALLIIQGHSGHADKLTSETQ